MELTQAAVLALVQGVTEFLPISSTAHLILVPMFVNWPDQGLAFDVALNTATWLAVVIYFRTDILGLSRGLVRGLAGGGLRHDREAVLALKVIAATVPVAAAGLLFHDVVAGRLRTTGVIGLTSIVWGVALWLADRRPGDRDVRGISWKAALFIGLFQALALVPGTSRSGITITAGLFAGLSRTSAARFSFLLAVVVGALAGANEGLGMIRAGMDTPWAALATGFLIAFAGALLAIHYFLKLISRSSMTPFVVYRVALGALLLAMVIF